jgi:hypothetical protein
MLIEDKVIIRHAAPPFLASLNHSRVRKQMGEFAGKTRQVLGNLIALAGLHQLYVSNTTLWVLLPLGMALGIHGIVDVAFLVTAEKSTDQLLLQEYAL